MNVSAPTVQITHGWYGKALELYRVRGNVFGMGLIEAPASGDYVHYCKIQNWSPGVFLPML